MVKKDALFFPKEIHRIANFWKWAISNGAYRGPHQNHLFFEVVLIRGGAYRPPVVYRLFFNKIICQESKSQVADIDKIIIDFSSSNATAIDAVSVNTDSHQVRNSKYFPGFSRIVYDLLGFSRISQNFWGQSILRNTLKSPKNKIAISPPTHNPRT